MEVDPLLLGCLSVRIFPTFVHVAVSRKGSVRADVVYGDSYAVLAPHVKQVAAPPAQVMTDQLQSYRAIGKAFACHESVNQGMKEFARGAVHVNTAESVLILKNVVDDLLLKAEDSSPAMQMLKNTIYSINYFLKSKGEVE